MTEFQLIDGPEVPPAIKPMTELHDKLVKHTISDNSNYQKLNLDHQFRGQAGYVPPLQIWK